MKIRRYFFDTEFHDKKGDAFAIDFISIGIVSENNTKFYGVSKDFNISAFADEDALDRSSAWLKTHVIDKLPPESERLSLDRIKAGILDVIEPCDVAEFWAKHHSYDNVLLCQIFGDLNAFTETLHREKGIRTILFKDTNTLREQLGWPVLPDIDPGDAHIAINDACHEKTLYEIMQKRCAGFVPKA